jgi:penicillin-binding protein 2
MNNNRLLFINGIMAVFFLILLTRIIVVQVVKADDYSYFAKKQQTGVEPLAASRGSIYDRNGTILVYSKDQVSFYVDPRLAKKFKKIH